MGNAIEGFNESQALAGEPVCRKITERGQMNASTQDKSQSGNKSFNQRPVLYGVSSMQGWRATMEDYHVAIPSLKVIDRRNGKTEIELNDHAVFGVLDGHGGTFTAEYAGKNFNRILCSRKEWTEYVALDKSLRSESPGIGLLKKALTGAFVDIDEELSKIHRERISKFSNFQQRTSSKSNGQRPHSRNNSFRKSGSRENRLPPLPSYHSERIILDRSGSTAVVVLLTPTHILCANAGDSRSILCRGGKALPLSFDHKPSNAVEQSRVNEAGGFVRMRRIDGDLAVSRGLGDFRYKLNDDLPWEKQKVTANPDFIVCPRDYVRDEFIILGCDGIWDVLDNVSCATMVQGILDEGEKDIGLVCEDVLDLCLERESKDNMTLCMVAFQACRFQAEARPLKENRDARNISSRSQST